MGKAYGHETRGPLAGLACQCAGSSDVHRIRHARLAAWAISLRIARGLGPWAVRSFCAALVVRKHRCAYCGTTSPRPTLTRLVSSAPSGFLVARVMATCAPGL